MWKIVTDSSGLISGRENTDDISFARVPFIIDVDGVGYIDDDTLEEAMLVDAVDASREAGKTACPSPEAWLTAFGDADKIIVVTISANLSGSYMSALTAKQMLLEKHPGRQVHVINSRGAGPTQTLCVRWIEKLINQGLSFDEVTSRIDERMRHIQTVFALCSYKNLIKNGRVGRLAGFMATTLRLWGVGVASSEGTIVIRSKVRGIKNALTNIVDAMREGGYTGGDVIIAHCLNFEAASELMKTIRNAFPNANVDITPTGGLCSFYAERGGLIISC